MKNHSAIGSITFSHEKPFMMVSCSCMRFRLLFMLILFCSMGQPFPLHAAITPIGNVSPANPGSWDSSTTAYIGDTTNGSLYVNLNSDLISSIGHIGNASSAAGTVSVDGAGSTWSTSDLYVGDAGKGTLNITKGGVVDSQFRSNANYIGNASGSTGTVKVDGTGSSWRLGSGLSVLYIGNSGNGTLNITNGGTVDNSGNCEIGYASGSTGAATVDGTNSKWNNSSLWSTLGIGRFGNGTLNIAHGGTVSVSGPTSVGPNGSINFGPGGGMLSTISLTASPSQLTGSGTVNTRGLRSDMDLVFDSSHGLTQTFNFNGVTVTLDFSYGDFYVPTGDLGAGYMGNGSLIIKDGRDLSSDTGYVGASSGSTGIVKVSGTGSSWYSHFLTVGSAGNGSLEVTNGGCISTAYSGSIGLEAGSKGIVEVDGADSKWNLSSNLMVGNYGNGSLSITRGGAVTGGYDFHSDSYLGYGSNSTGIVKVDGTGSKWTNVSTLCIGSSGTGILNISGGGLVTSRNVTINDRSLLAIDVGTGSLLSIGGGSSLTNNGIIRVLAGQNAAANAYTPISASIWNGTGTVQAVGGTWDATNHVFTVSGVQPGGSGIPVSIDRASTQRLLINDGASNTSLGASFSSTANSSLLTFTAAALGDGQKDDLNALLGTGQQLLGGWTISSSSGYTPGDPVYLSFGVGSESGYCGNDLRLWSYDGTQWSEFTADDLTCDGNYASFTTTSMGSFAVTVPEPSSLAVLAIGFAGVVGFGIRRRQS